MMHLAGRPVDDLGRGADEDAHREHRAFADDTPSATSARAPMKQLSSMIVGPACSGSSTPPMPAPPERWHVLADLRAGADRRPGVDHGALVDIGAEVDEGRHQHDARRDIGRAAHDGARHRAEARRLEVLSPQPRTSTAPCPTRRAAGPARDHGACRSGGRTAAPPSSAHWLTCHWPRRASRRRAARPVEQPRASPPPRRAPRPWWSR